VQQPKQILGHEIASTEIFVFTPINVQHHKQILDLEIALTEIFVSTSMCSNRNKLV
jgi:hypothetical protein